MRRTNAYQFWRFGHGCLVWVEFVNLLIIILARINSRLQKSSETWKFFPPDLSPSFVLFVRIWLRVKMLRFFVVFCFVFLMLGLRGKKRNDVIECATCWYLTWFITVKFAGNKRWKSAKVSTPQWEFVYSFPWLMTVRIEILGTFLILFRGTKKKNIRREGRINNELSALHQMNFGRTEFSKQKSGERWVCSETKSRHSRG